MRVRLSFPTSRTLAPLCRHDSGSGIRRQFQSDARDTITSPPWPAAASTSNTAARALLTTIARLSSGQPLKHSATWTSRSPARLLPVIFQIAVARRASPNLLNRPAAQRRLPIFVCNITPPVAI